jgi:hypothetical protein
MIGRIVSGGQTGVDRAALDVAIGRGIPCGGWCPKGRLAEDGVIPACYPLCETSTSEYAERTAWNVRDSGGTLILTWGPPAQGTAFTAYIARDLRKPCLVVDLAEEVPPAMATAWLRAHDIKVLNVAGPRASKCPHLYPLAVTFLETLLDCDQSNRGR